jgi:hypothetical protein
MVKTFAEALMSAEADAACGAPGAVRGSATDLPDRIPADELAIDLG